jgi:hypothetical protein
LAALDAPFASNFGARKICPKTRKARPGGCAFWRIYPYIHYLKLKGANAQKYELYIPIKMSRLGEIRSIWGLDKISGNSRFEPKSGTRSKQAKS